MSRPRLLDLYCGAGGAGMGYWLAGFDVVGVDLRPQPSYPFAFVQADALDVLAEAYDDALEGYDAIHASPPCQAYIKGGLQNGDHPRLIEPTRDALVATGLPWVIENVPGAPIRGDVVLCGSQFGLPVKRHRWFELSWAEPAMTLACDHSRPIVGVYGHCHGDTGAWHGMLPGSLDTWRAALDTPWMVNRRELADAIPPAYTEFVGRLLRDRVG